MPFHMGKIDQTLRLGNQPENFGFVISQVPGILFDHMGVEHAAGSNDRTADRLLRVAVEMRFGNRFEISVNDNRLSARRP